MIIGVDINETLDYISENDKEKDNPTIFVIKVMTNAEKLSILAGTIGTDSMPDINKIITEKAIPLLKSGLKEIKGLFDKTSNERKDYTVIDEDLLNKLPFTIISELITKIVELNFLGEQEQKNS